MRDRYIDITIVLDRSGSMEAIRQNMEKAIKEYLAEQAKDTSWETRVTLYQFDDPNGFERVFQAIPAKETIEIKLIPRGRTALLDALGRAIDETGQRLAAMAEVDRPSRVLMVIITDGAENASLKETNATISERVRRQTDHYQWQFIYLGANQDAFAEASKYGIASIGTQSYQPTASGVRQATYSLNVGTSNMKSHNSPSLTPLGTCPHCGDALHVGSACNPKSVIAQTVIAP